MKLQVKRLHPEAILPTRAYPTDSGYDLYSLFEEEEEFTILPQETLLVPTGIAVKLPKPFSRVNGDGTIDTLAKEAQVRGKSGLAVKQVLGLGNGIGTCDNSYIGQVKVILLNQGNKPQVIKNKQKVAQLVINEVVLPDGIEEIDILEETDRSANGFGSTTLFNVK